jgi:glucose/arabinose dehydrogenase
MHPVGRMRFALVLLLAACQGNSEPDPHRDPRCVLVSYGFGKASEVPIRSEVVASGLEVPWGLAFLPDRSMLVSERPGRLVRITADGRKHELAHVRVARRHEGGLLGIALHPDFVRNRWLYIYYTADTRKGPRNRVERWHVATDYSGATPERVIVDDIPSAPFHDGGRIAFGPDGKLYVGTGDATHPKLAQNPRSLAGKILRIEADGSIPRDNPIANSPIFVLGVRNVEALAWRDDGTLAVADHGPTGELGRTGHDEITLVHAGANLGWPNAYGCDARPGMLAPALTWSEAAPPGGAAFYDGGSIAEWRGDLVVATLKSQHLHHIRFDREGNVVEHDTSVTDRGRLRTAVIGPDHELYITTSNCDGRGECPPERDVILRVTRGD